MCPPEYFWHGGKATHLDSVIQSAEDEELQNSYLIISRIYFFFKKDLKILAIKSVLNFHTPKSGFWGKEKVYKDKNVVNLWFSANKTL